MTTCVFPIVSGQKYLAVRSYGSSTSAWLMLLSQRGWPVSFSSWAALAAIAVWLIQHRATCALIDIVIDATLRIGLRVNARGDAEGVLASLMEQPSAPSAQGVTPCARRDCCVNF